MADELVKLRQEFDAKDSLDKMKTRMMNTLVNDSREKDLKIDELERKVKELELEKQNDAKLLKAFEVTKTEATEIEGLKASVEELRSKLERSDQNVKEAILSKSELQGKHDQSIRRKGIK